MMGFLVPILMWLAFILVWIGLTKLILALNRHFMKRSLSRSVRLDTQSMAALLSLYIDGKVFFCSRWFPKRTLKGTLYEEIPCILILGKKIFVLEVCSSAGQLRNTDEEFWKVIPTSESSAKKEVQIKNPVLLALDRAALLKELLDKIGYASDFSVEAMAILTNKGHSCLVPAQKNLYTTGKAIAYLSRFAPKTKSERKKMQKISAPVFAAFERYSLAQRQAIAKNNKMREKRK